MVCLLLDYCRDITLGGDKSGGAIIGVTFTNYPCFVYVRTYVLRALVVVKTVMAARELLQISNAPRGAISLYS